MKQRMGRDFANLLERLSPTPGPTDAGERFFHQDLRRLNDAELRLEKARLSIRCALEPDSSRPSWWHADRLRRVEEALRRVR